MDDLTRLAEAARGGRPGAVEALIRGAHDDVWRLCAALVDEQAADDLAQDSFLRVMRALPGFRGEASARAWILAIARRACMDELRTRTRRRRRDAALGAERAPHVPDAADELGVQDLLARLEPDRRAAFVLTQILRLSYAEAAAICACPTGTIRSRVARARGDLIGLLDAGGAGERRDGCEGRPARQ